MGQDIPIKSFVRIVAVLYIGRTKAGFVLGVGMRISDVFVVGS